jgi:myo-inositol-1-phosphate synthase
MKAPQPIKPVSGRLGVLLPGMGAVATTFIAGVELARRGLGQALRLAHADGHHPPGQAHRQPLAADPGLRAPRALESIEFGAWDLFPDDAFTAATKAGVLSQGAPRAP